MKRTCCRSVPRCANCPVRAALAARRQPPGDDPAALLSEILGTGRARVLPDGVANALVQLDLARIR